MTITINFFGAPGAGKTTLATGVFSAMRRKGISAEFVPEFTKELVRERPHLLNNQALIFGEQLRRTAELCGKVPFIVTDSPLLMQTVYAQRSGWKGLAGDIPYVSTYTWASGRSVNFACLLPERDEAYEEEGRAQSVDQARALQDEILEMLDVLSVEFEMIDARTPKIIKRCVKHILQSV